MADGKTRDDLPSSVSSEAVASDSAEELQGGSNKLLLNEENSVATNSRIEADAQPGLHDGITMKELSEQHPKQQWILPPKNHNDVTDTERDPRAKNSELRDEEDLHDDASALGDNRQTSLSSLIPHHNRTKNEDTAAGDEKESNIDSSSGGKEPTFPVKLHRILSIPEYSELITWLPHGQSWRVLKPRAFEERIIPLFFRHTKYASFMRQVNGWGFMRMTQGPDHNSYHHELFLRDSPQLCWQMRRPGRAKHFALMLHQGSSSLGQNSLLRNNQQRQQRQYPEYAFCNRRTPSDLSDAAVPLDDPYTRSGVASDGGRSFGGLGGIDGSHFQAALSLGEDIQKYDPQSRTHALWTAGRGCVDNTGFFNISQNQQHLLSSLQSQYSGHPTIRPLEGGALSAFPPFGNVDTTSTTVGAALGLTFGSDSLAQHDSISADPVGEAYGALVQFGQLQQAMLRIHEQQRHVSSLLSCSALRAEGGHTASPGCEGSSNGQV